MTYGNFVALGCLVASTLLVGTGCIMADEGDTSEDLGEDEADWMQPDEAEAGASAPDADDEENTGEAESPFIFLPAEPLFLRFPHWFDPGHMMPHYHPEGIPHVETGVYEA